MWLFDLFKRNKPAKFEMQGQPLHVNPPDDSKPMIRRHLARILTCMDAIKKEDAMPLINHNRIASFQTEINRRRMQMEIAGRKVPGGYEEIKEALRRVGGAV